MKVNTLIIKQLIRTLSSGEDEKLHFTPGVNIIVGAPNTGKTVWLKMFDYLMGESDSIESLFGDKVEDGIDIPEKYQAIKAVICIAGNDHEIERRWKEPGVKSKVIFDGTSYSTKDFQHCLMDMLDIPLLHYPKGNPYTTSTWPELSWRELLRHIYRQQTFWSGIADQQYAPQQHMCILTFLNIAEKLFSDQSRSLVDKKKELSSLTNRKDQFYTTLNEVVRQIGTFRSMNVAVTEDSIQKEIGNVLESVRSATEAKEAAIKESINIANGSMKEQSEKINEEIIHLSKSKIEMQFYSDELNYELSKLKNREKDILRYIENIKHEIHRVNRAKEAGELLSDLKITNCPACDQRVKVDNQSEDECSLCHQRIKTPEQKKEKAISRIDFEITHLTTELNEANELLELILDDVRTITKKIETNNEEMGWIQLKLQPSINELSGLVQSEVSSFDIDIGRLHERLSNLNGIKSAFELRVKMAENICKVQSEIDALEKEINETKQAIDFETAEDVISDGMNSYLNRIQELKSDAWGDKEVSVNLSKTSFNIKVGSQRWNKALGGTNKLYFLMAYHYSLLKLSSNVEFNYPGILIMDFPAAFSGEDIDDKENFVVQPFIDLSNEEGYENCQIIVAGARFEGLDDVNRIEFTNIY